MWPKNSEPISSLTWKPKIPWRASRRSLRLIGSNSDWIGALRALEREIDPKGVRAVVLGAGGAARAVVYGLVQRGARVTVLNRTEGRAHELADALGAEGSGGLADLAKTPCDVLVNATTVGLGSDESPAPAEAIPASSVVMDCAHLAAGPLVGPSSCPESRTPGCLGRRRNRSPGGSRRSE